VWVYNFSRSGLAAKIATMLAHYDKERLRYKEADTDVDPVRFVDKDPQAIAWDDKLFRSVASNKAIPYSNQYIVRACYRPFTTMYFYFDRSCIWSAYRMPQVFP